MGVSKPKTKKPAAPKKEAADGLSPELVGYYKAALVEPGVIDSPIGRVDMRTMSLKQANQLVKNHGWPYLVAETKEEEEEKE